jgi:hypothetical protein
VAIGLAHALKEKFDWTRVLDEPDALANLLSFFETLPPSEREKSAFWGVGSRPRAEARRIIIHTC